MTMLNRKLAAALVALPLSAAAIVVIPVPAAAQGMQGIGVANPEAIVANSAAFRLAEQQRTTTYKAQLDQAEARRQQLSQQLQPLYQRLQTDSQAANPNQQSLQQQAGQIQRIEQQGQNELNQMLQPVALSRAYVVEQITDRLEAAMDAAKRRHKITLVLNPAAVVSADQAYNLNQAVLTELDRALPQAQLVPPAGWLPRAQREAQAAQAPAAAAAPQGNPAAPGR